MSITRLLALEYNPRLLIGLLALRLTLLAAMSRGYDLGALGCYGDEKTTSLPSLSAAILSTLTVPLLFLLGRRLLGAQVVFIAALLLALSEWHIISSREARIYVPFLFFYIAAPFSILYGRISAKPGICSTQSPCSPPPSLFIPWGYSSYFFSSPQYCSGISIACRPGSHITTFAY